MWFGVGGRGSEPHPVVPEKNDEILLDVIATSSISGFQRGIIRYLWLLLNHRHLKFLCILVFQNIDVRVKLLALLQYLKLVISI